MRQIQWLLHLHVLPKKGCGLFVDLQVNFRFQNVQKTWRERQSVKSLGENRGERINIFEKSRVFSILVFTRCSVELR